MVHIRNTGRDIPLLRHQFSEHFWRYTIPYPRLLRNWNQHCYLCRNLGIRLGETTPDGLVTVEEVMCLAACDRAPMFQVQDAEGIHYHENQTVESALELIRSLREKQDHG
jgi:hypothetical protein